MKRSKPGYVGAEPSFELKLADGRVVVWSGRDWRDAAQRYVDTHGGSVVAWRRADRHGIAVFGARAQIIEPGHFEWERRRERLEREKGHQP